MIPQTVNRNPILERNATHRTRGALVAVRQRLIALDSALLTLGTPCDIVLVSKAPARMFGRTGCKDAGTELHTHLYGSSCASCDATLVSPPFPRISQVVDCRLRTWLLMQVNLIYEFTMGENISRAAATFFFSLVGVASLTETSP